jgi:hypothetical protein
MYICTPPTFTCNPSFEGCSRLKKVCIGAIQWIDYSVLSAGLVTVDIPWPRLTSLSLHDHDRITRFTTIQARNISCKATKLTTFELLSSDPVQVAILHHSRCLFIASYKHFAPSRPRLIFSTLLLPCPCVIISESERLAVSPLLALQERSNFALTSLNLSLYLSTDDLILLLRPLHNLRRLKLKNCRVLSEILIQELIYSSHQTALVAVLEQLVIVDMSADVADDLVLDMLKSRQLSMHKLEEVILLKQWNDGGKLCASAARWVTALQRSGLQLEYPPFTRYSGPVIFYVDLLDHWHEWLQVDSDSIIS